MPVLPTPGGPTRTRFSARPTKSSVPSWRMTRASRPAWRSQGKVASDHFSGARRGARDDVQWAELADAPGVEARLAIEGESGQRPFLGHARVPDPTLDAALNLVLVLRTEYGDEQIFIARLRLHRLLDLVGQDLLELV